MEFSHTPVLLNSVCDYLNIQKDAWYLDATLGGGGHTAEIIRRGGRVIGLDQDQDAVSYCQEKYHDYVSQGLLKIHKISFSRLDEVVNQQSISGSIFDLGVSKYQLDNPQRGFSFQTDGPLDMRMDRQNSQTALSLISVLTPKQINQILIDFGEIKNGFHLSEKISQQKPDTTQKLAKLVNNPNLLRPLFQALRIAVNSELFELETALPKAYQALIPGGRLVIISFHSLEDRIVKNFPYGNSLVKSPIQPSETEISANPSAKSAKMRVYEKPYV